MGCSNQTQNGCSPDVGLISRRAITVEEYLNQCIETARKHVENLCIAKAKAETLGILKYPHAELMDMLAIF